MTLMAGKKRHAKAPRGVIAEEKYTLDGDAPDPEIVARAFSSGGYPYDRNIKNKAYRKQLKTLQTELCKVQDWQRTSGERIIMVFEGRDTAGKGGTIKRFTEFLNPRHAHVVALAKPTESERGEWYFQRYVRHFPTAGDMALFDRSWYNRAGVERVMGFCTEAEVEEFYREVPEFEHMITRSGTRLFKFWLTVGREEQLMRFHSRKTDPLKKWKLSPLDLEAIGKWDAYSAAKADMFRRTETPHAPWTVIKANDQKRARLEAIRVLLAAVDYTDKDPAAIGEVDPLIVGSGRDEID
jgi:polyphosphate kinase 2